MVQLVAYTQVGGNPTYLDLGDVSIKATYSSKEIQDVTKQKSDFTHNITLPFSQINNDFFAHYYEVNVDGSYRADIKAACSIYVDSNLTFEGYIQLLKVDTLNENYTVICFGDVANLATELGEAKLNDLDLSKYNHILSQANIENGWNGLTEYTGTLADGDEILYPIIDNGAGYSGITLNTNAGAIKPSDLKPSIKVKTLLDEIVSNAGYTLNSTFLNSAAFTKQYMTLGGDLKGSATNNLDGFKVGLTADQSLSSNASATVEFDNEASASGYYDIQGNFNTTSHSYVVPHTGDYVISVQIAIEIVSYVDDQFSEFRIYKNGSDVTSISSLQIGALNTIDVKSKNYSSLSLSLGDVITIKATAGNGVSIKILDNTVLNGATYDSFVKLVSAPNAVEGGTVDLGVGNNLLTKDKQIEFVKSIFSRYNLIAEVDKTTSKQLNIEPIQAYRDAGVSKDWTDKLDVSKSVIIEPTNRFRKDELNLTDKEDEDKVNKWWQTKNSQVYNSYKFPFYGDFGSGTLEVPSIFSSFAPEKFNNNRMFIAKHFEYNEDVAEAVKVKPKLFYYSGKKQLPPASNYKMLNSITGVYTTKVEYPFCHHYLMAGNLVVSTDTDLRFRSGSVLNESDLVETQTINDTYSLYWSKYLNNIYNKDARMQTAYFNLTAKDISEFKYNDKIFVKDSYWFINKISSYAMGMYNSTKVELIKIIEGTSSESCNLTMTSSNLDGSTNWVDSDGVATAPTAECCNEKNLTFINNTCRWKNR